MCNQIVKLQQFNKWQLYIWTIKIMENVFEATHSHAIYLETHCRERNTLNNALLGTTITRNSNYAVGLSAHFEQCALNCGHILRLWFVPEFQPMNFILIKLTPLFMKKNLKLSASLLYFCRSQNNINLH